MAPLFLTSARRGKAATVWCLVFFAASQAALGAYLHHCHPELCDPVFGNRLRPLRGRIGASPGAPLVVILGSSRAMNGLWPAAFPPPANGPTPVVYNFAVSGSGPVRELLHFHHLLADGIVPQWLFIETWPPLWQDSKTFDDRHAVVHDDLVAGDLPLLFHYFSDGQELLTQALEGSLTPIRAHRMRLLGATAGALLPRQQAWRFSTDMKAWTPPDATGWMPVQTPPVTPERLEKEMALGRVGIRPLVRPVRIDPRRDAALRQLLDECQARGVRAVLFLMPEHSEVRGWYTAEARACVARYLTSLGREHGVPVIDTRTWVADDGFADSAHMDRPAVAAFSERFGREVVRPLLAGEPLAPDVLLAEERSAP